MIITRSNNLRKRRGLSLQAFTYWRLDAPSGTNNGVTMRIGEFEVFENPVSPSTASAGNDDLTNIRVDVRRGDGAASSNAVNAVNNDGNTTYYEPGNPGVRVELPMAYVVRSFTYQNVFGGSRPNVLRLQGSNDGTVWTTMFEVNFSDIYTTNISRVRFNDIQ